MSCGGARVRARSLRSFSRAILARSEAGGWLGRSYGPDRHADPLRGACPNPRLTALGGRRDAAFSALSDGVFELAAEVSLGYDRGTEDSLDLH